MEGYDVVTIDDEKVGTIAGESGDFLIVEHGMLRKSKRALPRQLAHLDPEEQQVRMSVGKEIFLDSPELADGDFDARAMNEYYGLAPSESPGTEGFGVTDPGDPARSTEEQALRDEVEPAEAERARIRAGEPEIEESPALLGDRMAGVEDRAREEN
ncbi:MAG TPA: hypothetical protein VH650_01440 [Gaiellaceae bacterium]|jgi:hypothetical protein